MTTRATSCPDCGSEEVCDCPVEVRCAECNGTHRSHQVSGHPNHPDADHAPCGWCGGPALMNKTAEPVTTEAACEFMLESAKVLLPVFDKLGGKTAMRLGKAGVDARMIMHRNGDVFLRIHPGQYCPSPYSSFMNEIGFSAEYISEDGDAPPVFDGWSTQIR